jgi:hypothetical protein
LVEALNLDKEALSLEGKKDFPLVKKHPALRCPIYGKTDLDGDGEKSKEISP